MAKIYLCNSLTQWKIKFWHFYPKCKFTTQTMLKIHRPGSYLGVSTFSQFFLDEVFMRFMGSPNWEDIKIAIWEVNFRGIPDSPPLLGVLGAWMTFKKAEMAKTLKNGLSMIEMNSLNHNWSQFMILLGLTLHQF